MTTLVGAGPSAAPLPRARRRLLGVSVLAVALIAAVTLSLLVGANPLSVDALLDTLAGNGTPEAAYVLYDLRIPRTSVGLAAGAALGIAGALIQAFTRNPLADPGILGVNAGAALAVAIGVAWLGLRDASAFVWLAFLGALIVTVAVYLVGSAGRGAADPLRLTLAGVALGAVLSGITTGLTLTDPEAFDTLRSWNAGSLLASGLDGLFAVLPFLGIGVVIALAVTGGLNALGLGEDVARAQGANVALLRTGVIVAVTLLAGTATALAGPIAFVGLMVPHVIRWTFGVDQRLIVPLSAVLAPVVVLLSDVVGRVIIAPAEVPVGVVAALVGAPVLIVLARRRKASSL
ncbi:iron chelate uptake ABC transporter family permease subunit [Microbacterium sp. LEMMJ01]|uniref:iron chelate uptake ABC transporter family permease subunit n=1 Tax=Microbacterium sp. LEMMJ01 TaxID=1978350 RepID=UPI000A1FB668|nr:iron chelate uptake ABC transporter family permease subunit [Microbacterium sp. LEMMJ01]OSO98127.1 ABC transporter permease [Microbacterium sp. LEMMJ01]